ncbi:MAG: BTAD domain-containing putative transcriptional regulator [Actinomycetales bacterium]
MWVGVLGRLVGRDDAGDLLTLGGPTRRRLLAALVARVGQTVAAGTLVEDVWGEAPPRSALKTLQSHVVRLRRDLGRAAEAKTLIQTEGTGYRLNLSPLAVDTGCFERDLQLGMAALGDGDPERARGYLDAALGWWRGEAYGEFTDAQFAVVERLRLSALYALAHERRFDAALLIGEHASVAAEIERRVAADPYRERLWEQLMLALYRAGRQADALAAYRQVRTLLRDELGLEPGPGLRQLEARMLAHDAGLQGPRDRDGLAPRPPGDTVASMCPYRGLSRYEPEDSALFVAREALTARLVARLSDGDLVTVTGASGTGKSSLVRAGLVAAVRAGALPGSAAWRCAVTSPQDLASLDLEALDLLVLDQAEELFTLAGAVLDPVETDARLTSAMAAGARVVLVIRSDYYGSLAELPRLTHRVGGSTLLVPPLDDHELRQVVTEPARRVGLELEPALLDAVLDDVRGHPGALPLVSAALARTWANRDGRRLTVEGYRAGGGVRRALEASAEDAYLGLNDEAQARARRLLVRLATSERGLWARRPLPRDVAATLVDERTLGELSEARLLTITEARVELVHEALLDGWPRLRSWLERRREIVGLVEHLDAASRAWSAGGRQDADLYRGPRLQGALDWRRDEPEDLTALEAEFLDAGAGASEAELLAARARAQEEATGRRRLRRVAAALAVVTAIAGVGVVVSLHERSSARAAAAAAVSQKVAALSLTAPDLRTSLLLATAAYRLQDSPDTRSALLSALERNGSALWRLPTPGRVDFLGVSAHGNGLWVMNQRRTLFRYDLTRRAVATSFAARADATAALSPDGRQLVVVGSDGFFDRAGAGRISVLDAVTGTLLRVLPVTTVDTGATSASAAFTGDGRWLAVVQGRSVSTGGDPVPTATVEVFATDDYAAPPRRVVLDGPVTELAAGRSVVAVGSLDGQVDVVRPSDGRVLEQARRADLARASLDSGTPYALAVSPDGGTLALTRPGHPALPYLLDAGSIGGALRPTEELGTELSSLAFSPTGRLLAAAAADGPLDVFRVADGRVLLRPLGVQAGQSPKVAWSGSSTADTGLYVGGLDAQVLSLDLRAGPRLVGYTGPRMADQGQSFLSGRYVVTVGATGGGLTTAATPISVADRDTGASRSITFASSAQESIQYVSSDSAGHQLLVVTETPDRVMHSTLVDIGTGRALSTFVATRKPTAHNTYVGIIAPNGRSAAFAVDDHRLVTYTLPGWRRLAVVDVHFGDSLADRHLVSPIAFAPDGRLLVLGFDPTPTPNPPATADVGRLPPVQPAEDQVAGLVNLRTGRLVGQVDGFGVAGIPDAAAWSPDGRRLAIGTLAGTVRVVDARALAPISDAVTTVSGVVQTVSWSPDGNTLVVGGSDGTMSFWTPTLRPIGAPVRSARVDSWWAWYDDEGSVVGYAPSDLAGQERWFHMPAQPGLWAGAACRLAASQLSRAEWRRYVGSAAPYRRVC